MARISRYEGSCHKSRGYVSIVTRTRNNRYEPPMIVAGGANHPSAYAMYGYKSRKGVAPFHGFALCVKSWCRIFPRTISGISDTNLSAAPAQGRLKKEQNRKREAQQRPLPNPSQGSKSYNKPHPYHLQEQGVPSNRLKHSKKRLPPLGEGWGGALGGLGWGLSVVSYLGRLNATVISLSCSSLMPSGS